jgi:HAD superfamily hydrolase (TIGR01549 family)
MSERPPVLLDFGGTLDSEGKHWSTQFADSFAANGLRPPRSELDAAFIVVDRMVSDDPRAATMPFGDYILEYAQRILLFLGIEGGSESPERPAKARAIAEHFLDRALEHLRKNRTLLAQYREHYRLAIVSNFTANLPIIIEEVGLRDTLDDVFCSAVEGLRKPDPAFFRLALRRLGVDAAELAEVTMIGDSLGNDMQPAKSLGLNTIWLRGDDSYAGGHPSAADHVVTTLADAFLLLSPPGISGLA